MFAKYVDENEEPNLPILDRIGKCAKCGLKIQVPILPEFRDPLYVEHVRTLNEFLQGELVRAHEELLELAAECVDAGVRPSILKRADELKLKLEELFRKYRFGE